MKSKWILLIAVIAVLTSCNPNDDAIVDANPKAGSITRFAVFGDYMYALDQNQVLVYSLADAANPQLINHVPTDYGLETIIIYDETIYVGSRSALYILDISDPRQPVLLSKTERRDELLGGCDPVVVKGNFAFSTVKVVVNICGRSSFRSLLLVYDVTDKTNPVEVNSVEMDIPNGLGYEGNYLFICDEGSDRIEIFDITNPANPQLFGGVELTDPIDLITNGNKIIVSTRDNFTIYDISDMQNIREIGVISLV